MNDWRNKIYLSVLLEIVITGDATLLSRKLNVTISRSTKTSITIRSQQQQKILLATEGGVETDLTGLC